MKKRLSLLLTVMLLLVSVLSTKSAEAVSSGGTTFVLNQSHQFDSILGKENLGKFGSSNVKLTLTFPKPVTDLVSTDVKPLAGKNVGVGPATEEVTVDLQYTSPESKKTTASLVGNLETVLTSSGSAVYGSFWGMARDMPIGLTFTYDPTVNQTWVVASFGALNDPEFTFVPFGVKHDLVAAVAAVKAESYKANALPTKDNKQQPDNAGSTYTATPTSSPSSSDTPNEIGYAATYVSGYCGGRSYPLAAQYSFGPPDTMLDHQSYVIGGRVFSYTPGVRDFLTCRYYKSWGELQIKGADNTITAPTSYYGSGQYPDSSTQSFNIIVPLWAPGLNWWLQALTIPTSSISASMRAANGSGYPNQLVHKFSNGGSASERDADQSVNLYSQGDPNGNPPGGRGWAGQALFSYQGSSSGSDIVCQRSQVHYEAEHMLGMLILVNTDSRDVCWRSYYAPR